MIAADRPAETGGPPAPLPPGPLDSHLIRLRTLLRMQLHAADTASWAAFHALAAAVRDELDRHGGSAADEAALAEVAHLQLRLEMLLQERAERTATMLRSLAAQRAYLTMTGPRAPTDPTG